MITLNKLVSSQLTQTFLEESLNILLFMKPVFILKLKQQQQQQQHHRQTENSLEMFAVKSPVLYRVHLSVSENVELIYH